MLERLDLDGLALARAYWGQMVRPLLDEAVPHIPRAAARIGSGSDVLGLDDEMSRDHDWGLRLQLIVPGEHAAEVEERRHTLWIRNRGLPCPRPRFVTQPPANAHGWVLGEGESVPGESRESIGAWWDPEVWQRARAAYMYDLRHHPEAPAGFIQWLHG